MRHQIWWGFILIGLYLTGGFLYNVASRGRPLEPASLPHYEALSALGLLVREWAADKLQRLRGGASVQPKYGIGGEEVLLERKRGRERERRRER